MSNNKLRVGIVGYGIVGHRRRLFIDKNPYKQLLYVTLDLKMTVL